MIKRKAEEIGSILYRRLIFPFIRAGLEIKYKSILKQGSYLNKGTKLLGRNYVGKDTVLSGVELGFGSSINNNGDLSYTRVGKYTSIGPNVRTILGKHPTEKIAALHPAFYSPKGQYGFTYVSHVPGKSLQLFEEEVWIDKEERIRIDIGNDVWIGEGVSILEGVRIGDGAIIGAASLVNKDIEPYGVYAGVPARKLRSRFDKEQREKLLRLRWWDKGEDWIRNNISRFFDVNELTASEENKR